MNHVQEQQRLDFAVRAMRAAGYDPYAQLNAFLVTGNAAYITRRYGARDMIGGMDRRAVGKYLTARGRLRSA